MKFNVSLAVPFLAIIFSMSASYANAVVDGYDETGHSYTCPRSTDEDVQTERLSTKLKTQKTCTGVSDMFEKCRGGLTVYPLIELSQGRVIPTCERAMKKDAAIIKLYARKSKACKIAGVGRSAEAASNQCQRELAIALGKVAELK